MIKSVLVAGRGVGACHVIRSLRRLSIHTVAVHSEVDRAAMHALLADRALCVGNAPAAHCYGQAGVILDAARITSVDAIHPGYGQLSTNPDFAQAVARLGMGFIGPSPATLRLLSNPANLEASVAGTGAPQMVPRDVLAGSSSCRRLELNFFGDGQGRVTCLGETERLPGCRAITRGPPIGVRPETIAALRQSVTAAACAFEYQGVGTLSLLLDENLGHWAPSGICPGNADWFAFSEAWLGIDLVEWTVRAIEKTPLNLSAPARHHRYALAADVFAGSPAKDAAPVAGIITGLALPGPGHVYAGIEIGAEISSDSEPHLLTLVVTGSSQAEAMENLAAATLHTEISGIETNLDELRAACGLASAAPASKVSYFEVLRPGTFTIVVDYPGRLGYWPIGVPPSGPMDDLSHRYANGIVGNSSAAASLEMTLAGPTLRFESDAVVAFVGGRMPAYLDGVELAANHAITIRAGQTLRFGTIDGTGSRTYLAIRGGVQVAPYLDSATTFTLGGFGGHNGRALRQGDRLRMGNLVRGAVSLGPHPSNLVALTHQWTLGVLYGPHAAPEFFTIRDILVLFDTEYEVHFNSNRTGVRLVGPKPDWARADGGEAGLHPSNIHDVPYAVGAIDFTGDMPILLGPDGPSLGGFVCPATVVSAELWKLGQLRSGDRVRFVPISEEQARDLQHRQEQAIEQLLDVRVRLEAVRPERAILAQSEATQGRASVTYRRAGDRYLLVEYGPMVLDLRLRFRVHALMQWLTARELPGVIELTPGIRSLQIHFDDSRITRKRLLDELASAEDELPKTDGLEVPSRIVRLPLSWDDPQTRLAIQKYTQSVRPDAPWCPSNIEFIRRINGLANQQEVYDIVFGARYLVLGLGDVYLGAPVATPIDPRHRLVTTKYNPARTWTPENAVGIGGAYLCIYGMEGPGGYQFVGRTIQVYNRYRRTQRFTEGHPWLLRFFDQLHFYPVSAEQLLDHRRDFLTGKFDIQIEETRFKLAGYQEFLTDHATSIQTFKAKQQAAFEAERQRWVDSGQLSPSSQQQTPDAASDPKRAPRNFECA